MSALPAKLSKQKLEKRKHCNLSNDLHNKKHFLFKSTTCFLNEGKKVTNLGPFRQYLTYRDPIPKKSKELI